MLLERHGMAQANALRTPLPITGNLTPCTEKEGALSSDAHAEYRAGIGGLMYLAVSTRPDLAFSVFTLTRSLHSPTHRHMVLFKRLLRYLRGTIHYGIFYPSNMHFLPNTLEAYVDSDWTGCHETRRSTTGLLFTIGRSPILWSSKRQSIVALSSTEAEYVAFSSCGRTFARMRELC